MPDPTAALKKTYDQLLALRRDALAAHAVDLDGVKRLHRIEQASADLRKTGTTTVTSVDRSAVRFELDSIEHALRGVVTDLVAILGKDRRRIEITHLPIGEVDADGLVAAINKALDLADTVHAANEAAQRERREYTAALDRFNTLRAELELNGTDPRVASEHALAALSEQEKLALWPSGGFGGLELSGRTIGEAAVPA